MSVKSAAGYPLGGSSGVSRYTPLIFTRKLLVKFYAKTVFGDIANRDYEGEITKMGDKVIIRTIPDVTVFDYLKGMDLNTKRKTPESPAVELLIDKAKAYSVMIDDIDKIQNDIDALDQWASDGSEQLGISIDRSILNVFYTYAHALNKGTTAGKVSGSYDMGVTNNPVELDKSNVLETIADAEAVLSEHDVPETDRWMVIPTWMANLIQKSDLKNASFSGDSSNRVLRNGRIGELSNFTLYKSNNLIGVTDSATSCYNIPFGHKTALTFASQFVKNRVLELQNTFGTALEGLQVYGWEVVKPESMGVLYACKGAYA